MTPTVRQTTAVDIIWKDEFVSEWHKTSFQKSSQEMSVGIKRMIWRQSISNLNGKVLHLHG